MAFVRRGDVGLRIPRAHADGDLTERTLRERELNRALLARQLLLQRSNLPVPRAVERIGGLQTQYAPSGYIGLWSRLNGFDLRHLTGALERRAIVQGTLMRGTIHMVSSRDYWPFAMGIRAARRAWWMRPSWHRDDGPTVETSAAQVRELLADGPRQRADIVAALGFDNVTFGGAGLWVDLVRVPPSGTWEQRRADRYGLAEDWVGPADVAPEDGVEHLVRRYLGAFGPASRKDIASWAGLRPTSLTPVLERMTLRHFRSEDGDALIDLSRASLPDVDTPAPIRFLPTWDATLLTHARRTQILPEVYRPRVFDTKTPHSVPTFLVDGQVAGTWRFERRDVTLQPFHTLTRATRAELDVEAERLTVFMRGAE